jgi:hypothetical protein
MPKNVRELVEHTRSQAAYMIGFSLLFIVVGWLVPAIYYQYFDQTEYYKIKRFDFDSPEFKTCTPITYTFTRVSLINSEIMRDRELVLVNADTRQEIWHERVEDIIDVGEATIRGTIVPPCNSPRGRYMLNILVTYPYRGRERTYLFKSSTFLINSATDAGEID